jgi:polyhydroxyalkanoate synthesis regulator phasin
MAQGKVEADGRNQAIVQRANLYLNARKDLLSSLGALALTLEESNDFIDRLVTRGTLAEADVQKLLGDGCSAEQKKVESLLNDFTSPLSSEFLPSETGSLSQRISLLAQKINTLVDQREQQRAREV